MHPATLRPTLQILLLMCLESAALAGPQEIRWPIHSTEPPPIVQGFSEFGDVSKTKYHTGLDLGVPLGSPVFPIWVGEVVFIQLQPAASDHGFGRTVVMRHSGVGKSVFYSQYSHLSEVDAKLVDVCKPKRAVGEITLTCEAGIERTPQDRIGRSGRSGVKEDGPAHLHFEVKSFAKLCTSDTAGIVCGYSTAPPSTIGYLDPIEWLMGARLFPKPIPVIVTANGVAVRFMPDAGQGKRPITLLNGAANAVPLRGIAWASGYGSCDSDEWIQVRRVDDPNCGTASGASACFQDTMDPDRKSAGSLGLVPTAWICAKDLLPTKVTTAREAVTDGVLLTGGSVEVKRAGIQGLTIEIRDRDGEFSVFETSQLGSDAVSDLWSLIFLDMTYPEPSQIEFARFAATHRDLAATLLARNGATCVTAQTTNSQAACAIGVLAKSRRVRMGGGRYDEGYRCVSWRDRPNGQSECQPY